MICINKILGILKSQKYKSFQSVLYAHDILKLFRCLWFMHSVRFMLTQLRQYIDTSLILFISLISLWAFIQTYRLHNEMTFEMLPLGINFTVSLIMFFLQLLYEQFYNTHLILMFIEFFTYYLLTYALVWMYLKADVIPNQKLMKRINLLFVFGSVFIVLVAVIVTLMTFVDVLKCTTDYWVATVVETFLLVPIYVCTLIYCSKTKQKIYQLNENRNDKSKPTTTFHLINDEDSYVKLKVLQTNLTQITFTMSMLLNVAQITLYLFMENESICLQGSNSISVRNPIELGIMSIKNLSQLIPHVIILLTFWIIPQKINRKSSVPIYISPRLVNPKIGSNYKIDMDDQEIHKKLIN